MAPGPHMGGGQSVLTTRDLETYEACTCLNSGEVLDLLAKFKRCGGLKAPEIEETKTYNTLRVVTRHRSKAGRPNSAADKRASVKAITAQPELANNPFRYRLAEIFSSDGSGGLYFEEFVDLYHNMSARAPLKDKIHTAFRVYDFDRDGYIMHEDLEKLLVTLGGDAVCGQMPISLPPSLCALSTSHRSSSHAQGGAGRTHASLLTTLDEEHIIEIRDAREGIAAQVMRHVDIDGNGRISYPEFAKFMHRVPDFATKFRLNWQ